MGLFALRRYEKNHQNFFYFKKIKNHILTNLFLMNPRSLDNQNLKSEHNAP